MAKVYGEEEKGKRKRGRERAEALASCPG